MNSKILARKNYILSQLNNNIALSIQNLAEKSNVSSPTIRRDINELQAGGYVTLSTGNVTINKMFSSEPSFQERMRAMRGEKLKIGRQAASLIKNNDTIILDNSTTSMQLIPHLTTLKKVHLITSSIYATREAEKYDNIDVLLLGGFYRKKHGDVFGMLAENALGMCEADKAFLGVDAVHPDKGFYTLDTEVTNLIKRMISISKEIYICADSSKIGKVALLKFIDLSEVTALITTKEISEKQKQALEDSNLEFVLV